MRNIIKNKKILVMVPPKLLNKLDCLKNSLMLSRSGVIRIAIKEYVEKKLED